MHHPISGARLRKLLATTALSATALTLAAGGTASAAVGDGRQIEVFHGSNLVGLSGYPDTSTTTVEAVRNGSVIASATFTGDTVLNHGPGECWPNSTPDMQPGDVVRATLADGTVDTMTVSAVSLAAPTLAGNTVSYSGSVPEAADYGFRLVFDTAPRLDETVSAAAAGPISGTVNLTNAQAAQFDGAEWSLEHIVGGNEITVADEPMTTAAAECPDLARSAVLTAPAASRNASQASTTISGITSAGITAAVTVGGTTTNHASGAWNQLISTAALQQGVNTVTVAYDGAGAPADETFTIFVDTIAPAQPAATFDDAARTARLTTNDPAATIFYTTDGSAPSPASSIYSLPFNLPFGTTQIKAIAVDAVGNASTLKDVTVTYDAPATNTNTTTTNTTDSNTSQTATTTTQTSTSQPQPQPQPQPEVVRPVSAASLRVTGSRSLRAVRRNGLRYSVRVSDGTRFLLVRLVRVKGSKRTVVQERVVRVSRAGLHNGTLRLPAGLKRGRYQLEVAPAGRDERYSAPTRTSVRIG